jgi:nucleoside-diphosphate-sugar epimerase
MLSKLYGEAMMYQAGVPGIIIRPHNLYGPRMGLEHVIPELMKRIHVSIPGSELRVFSPRHRRTFCYIDDAVGLIKGLVLKDDAIGSAWNIGSEGPEYEIEVLASMINRLMGGELKIVGGQNTKGSPARRCPSMARTNALTGLHSRIPLEEGLTRTLRWYQTNVFSSFTQST